LARKSRSPARSRAGRIAVAESSEALNPVHERKPPSRHRSVEKRLIDPGRVRVLPKEGFSWIDRRFVRDSWIDRLVRDEILVYFFLVTVADRHGLSYYSDHRISAFLKLPVELVDRARWRLVEFGLIAYAAPLYQVLALATAGPALTRRGIAADADSQHRFATDGAVQSIGEILKDLR
jgi:hypothetical protein